MWRLILGVRKPLITVFNSVGTQFHVHWAALIQLNGLNQLACYKQQQLERFQNIPGKICSTQQEVGWEPRTPTKSSILSHHISCLTFIHIISSSYPSINGRHWSCSGSMRGWTLDTPHRRNPNPDSRPVHKRNIQNAAKPTATSV